jgi:hypothetical protein
MNDGLTKEQVSDMPEPALLAVQVLRWRRRFWTLAPQSSFRTQRRYD